MSKGENQRLKLYYLYKIMVSLTDDEHSITVEEIINELDKYGISAERKSIYMHKETAYIKTKDKEIIPFSLAKEIKTF